MAEITETLAFPQTRRPAREATRLRRKRRLGPGKRIPYAQLVGPSLLVALWALTSQLGVLDPRIIPAPWTVIETAAERLQSGKLPEDILVSLKRAATGFSLGLAIGVTLALAAGLSRIGEALIDGTVQVKRAIPVLGLIP